MKKRKTNSTFTDQDYWNRLSDEEKEWLRDFNKKEYYNGKRNHDINDDLFSVFRNVKSINENFDESQIQEAVFEATEELEEESTVLNFWDSLTQRQQKQFVKILKLRAAKIMKNLENQ